MIKKAPLVLLFSWLIVIGSTVLMFTSGTAPNWQYFLISIYTLLSGSFIFFKSPKNASSRFFSYLSSVIALIFLFIYSGVGPLNFFALVLLCTCPNLLYLFLFKFTQSNDYRLFRNSNLILAVVATYAFSTFTMRFYPDFHLAFLLLVTVVVCIWTIYRQRTRFYNGRDLKILTITLFFSFIPFIMNRLIFLVSPFVLIDSRNALLLIMLFPTYVVVFFVQNQLTPLSRLSIIYLLLFLISIPLFMFLQFLNIQFFKGILITTFFVFMCSISLAINYLAIIFNRSKVKKSIQSQTNEKIEILNQINYSNFFNSLSDLVLNVIQKETHSETVLVLMADNGSPFIFCQSGQNILKTAKQLIKSKHSARQLVTINGELYYFIPMFQPPEQIFVCFRTTETLDLNKLEAFITQYSNILKFAKLMHLTDQKYIRPTVKNSKILQMKLFSSIQQEKNKHINYLHDTVLQPIIALRTLTSNLQGDKVVLELIDSEITKLIDSIRLEIFDTSPSTLYHLSFEENIQILMNHLNQRYPETDFQLSLPVYQSNPIPDLFVAPVYRIIKELNENIGKHAQATIGRTTIVIDSTYVTITVQDNGVGMDDAILLEQNLIQAKGHIGLLSIKNEVSWLNGSFKIGKNTIKKNGTAFSIVIPVNTQRGAEFRENIADR